MKNAVLPLCLSITLFFYSTFITSAQADASGIRGNWEITEISTPVANVFGIADSKCFIGSTWKFTQDNKGSLKLNASGCPSLSSEIGWSINKEGNLVLKIIEAGSKSKANTEGFVLKVANQETDKFQLINVVKSEGQDKEVIYQFEKIFEFQ